jgi:hypothetical protein
MAAAHIIASLEVKNMQLNLQLEIDFMHDQIFMVC